MADALRVSGAEIDTDAQYLARRDRMAVG